MRMTIPARQPRLPHRFPLSAAFSFLSSNHP